MAISYPANAGRKMGPTVRTCYVGTGHVLMLEAVKRVFTAARPRPAGEVSDYWYQPARNLRDGVAVEVVSVDRVRVGRQTGYRIKARRLDNADVIHTGVLFGQNAIKTAVAR